MQLTVLSPRKALNKSYLKVKPSRSEIELFKKNLISLLDGMDESESEEHNKNDLGDFLKNTFYHPRFYINTKDRTDLVIHNGPDSKSLAGVLIEAKKLSNKSEMIRPDWLNAKAFHELILYYLRERITNHNLEIKHLVATNIYEWYVFDALIFEKTFAQDKKLVQQFIDFEEGRLPGRTTDFFYKEITEPFLAGMTTEFCFTWFDFKDYDKPLRNEDKKDDSKLIALYKLLSPEHLLKLPFANDSNSLDKAFYTELLHIIGLIETKEGSKKLIGRKKEGERNSGSLIESAIIQLDSLDKISRLEKPSHFGETVQERLFNVSLELSITWINRILFLKLLEAQMIRYHKGDPAFAFLNSEKVQNFDDLNSLFFSVLARKQAERNEGVRKQFANVPYLNSSLFEPTGIEHSCLFISQLKDGKLPIITSTVLKDNNGKKCKGELYTLEYLFKFLDAYDFAGEGSEEIQEENKTLINASVLGLIFEKINGYKDGSFFTPGFITMYMCRETIRRAVLQKFNDFKGWNCGDLEGLYNNIDDIKEANEIINQLKICDPAVGSGHFLVSALNEIIAIKSELKILSDREGRRLKEYHIDVVNDELIITDEDGRLFEYNPTSPESQRVQEAIFHEKQTIIENCLFGVDINPNSVKICRLRLWIELLKNAYYNESKSHKVTELETLPNIDINIKCGNSLISRYALDSDIKAALKKSKWNIFDYRNAVMSYRNAGNKEQKRAMEDLIASIKNDFQTEVAANDKRLIQLKKLNGELFNLTNQTSLFERTKKEVADWNLRIQHLASSIQHLEHELEEIKNNKIYENAFEWRFEFPEVLNDEGKFVGFDVIIGNPPYLNFKMYSKTEREIFKNDFKEVFDGKADIYYFFFLQGLRVVKLNGVITYITSRYWLEAEFAEKLRKTLSNSFSIKEIIDFKNVTIFDGIGIKTSLSTFNNTDPIKGDTFKYKFINTKRIKTVEIEKFTIQLISNDEIKTKIKWVFGEQNKLNIYSKIEIDTVTLESIADCKSGIQTGCDKAFILKNKEGLNGVPAKIIKRWIKVGDIQPYFIKPVEERFLIYTNSLVDIEEYPKLKSMLSKHNKKLMNRREVLNGKIRWFDLQWGRDVRIFENPKLVCRFKASGNTFAYDTSKFYSSTDTTIVLLNEEVEKSKEFDLKYLLALLNSKLLDFYFKSYGKLMDYRYEYYSGSVGKLRIKKAKNQNDIVQIVDKIIELKNKNPQADTSDLEIQIDKMVYELYGLTEEEIMIVEVN